MSGKEWMGQAGRPIDIFVAENQNEGFRHSPHEGTPMSAPWITYRPELKVLDCTIRDGGLCNDHAFEDGFVKAVYEACAAAGIDYMELGYKSSKGIFAPE